MRLKLRILPSELHRIGKFTNVSIHRRKLFTLLSVGLSNSSRLLFTVLWPTLNTDKRNRAAELCEIINFGLPCTWRLRKAWPGKCVDERRRLWIHSSRAPFRTNHCTENVTITQDDVVNRSLKYFANCKLIRNSIFFLFAVAFSDLWSYLGPADHKGCICLLNERGSNYDPQRQQSVRMHLWWGVA